MEPRGWLSRRWRGGGGGSRAAVASPRAPRKDVTPLDWLCVLSIQSLSMISVLSTTYIFSTAVFMANFWGATDEAKAAAHAGIMIAAKPAFSALSSYAWGRAGDRLGFRYTMLTSSAVVAVLTAMLGMVSSFYWAIALRATCGFCDGMMTSSKSAMAKISDRTNSAKAFSTFGITYGMGATLAPSLAAVLAYPCGGDPNGGHPVFPTCPGAVLRAYPFLLSSGWVLLAAVPLWCFSFTFLKIVPPPSNPKPKTTETTQIAAGTGGGDVHKRDSGGGV
eukprot:CAMPEP_0197584996 /NCGR_PEP_ID=MMETSP1326-20131121/7437_1 /TAXON_ID=1155430 /ORGANISM="Genus nov. species nov., Strain RCC2288" /LENGTH=276 /DNA_ID=CAMNT_0043149445 /DNA_START=188 /DNA_END=1015 /DNA_ORIENTATION=+